MPPRISKPVSKNHKNNFRVFQSAKTGSVVELGENTTVKFEVTKSETGERTCSSTEHLLHLIQSIYMNNTVVLSAMHSQLRSFKNTRGTQGRAVSTIIDRCSPLNRWWMGQS